MSVKYQNLSMTNEQQGNPAFYGDRKILRRPIEDVQTVIESGVDTFIDTSKDDEKRKRIRKRAIAASSTVLVLGSLTLLLNPRSSSKLGKKLQELQNKTKLKITQNKGDSLKTTFYKYWHNVLSVSEKTGNLYFNLNSGKDWAWDALCTNNNKKYPEFLTKNKTVHDVVKALDDCWVKLVKTPTEAITKWFDNISINTVKSKYRKSLKELDALEISLKAYKDKLPADKQLLVENKLKEIAKAREAFSEENVLIRLKKQECMMSNLKDDFAKKIHNEKDGWLKNVTRFWARDILEPQKAVVEREGTEYISKLFGDNGSKGLYDDVYETFKGHLDEKQLKSLSSDIAKAKKKISKANFSECNEYFDKKRDLILGGAPTDILTQIFGLGLCGWAVTRADKEDRWSKLFNTGLPVITGLGSSLIFSAKLYAGAKSLIAGAAVSGLTTLFCSLVNKHVFGHQDEEENIEKNEKQQQTVEVQNA